MLIWAFRSQVGPVLGRRERTCEGNLRLDSGELNGKYVKMTNVIKYGVTSRSLFTERLNIHK